MSAPRSRSSRLLAAVRYRRSASAAMFVVSCLAVLAAAVGPVYASAADQAVLHHDLSAAAPSRSGLSLFPRIGAVGRLPTMAAAVSTARHLGWYGAPILTAETGGLVEHGNFRMDLVSRTGVCAHLSFVAGHCPVAGGQVAISRRSALAINAGLGRSLVLQPADRPAGRLDIVGIYRSGNAAAHYWWQTNYFIFGQSPPNFVGPAWLDAGFATLGTIRALGGGHLDLEAQLPVRPDALTTDRLPLFRRELAALTTRLALRQVTATTGIGSLLSAEAAEQGRMTSIIGVAAGELVLLALITLYTVAAGTGADREPELALATLRGFRPRTIAAVAMTEPLVVLGVAAPIGLGLAWLVVRLAAPATLGTAAVGLPATAWYAAAGALAAAVVTLALAIRRLLRPKLASGLQLELAVGRTGRRGYALEAGATVAAAAGLVAVLSGGRVGAGNAVAALAPGLLALAVALLARRALGPLGRLASQARVGARRAGAFLAVRQVARRTAAGRYLLVVTVSFSLLAFAVAEWSAAATNRFTQAAFLDGAARVLTVHLKPGRSLRAAVEEADPTGRYAMAVERVVSPTEDLVAVDSSRFARVAEWSTGVTRLSAATIAARLHPYEQPPLYVAGSRLRLAITVKGQPTGGPSLTASVFDFATQSSSTADFGRLRPGTHNYVAPLGGVCTNGCRLQNVEPTWPGRLLNSAHTENLTVVLTGIQTGGSAGWRAIPGLTARLADPAAWQGASASVAKAAHGLLVDYRLGANGSQPSLAPHDVPTPLPAATTPSVVADNDAAALGLVPGIGLDAASVNFRPAAVLPTLPGVGTSGILVDLSYAELAQTGPAQNVVDQVWLDAAAPPRIVHRLRAAGLAIVGQVSAASQASAAESSGPALGDTFFLLTAAVAGLLAMGAVLVVQLTERRRRAVEAAALRAAGLRWRQLRGALLTEQVVLIGWASLVGIAAGIAAAALTLPVVPGVDRLAGGPPLTFPLPVAALAGSLLALFAALLAIAAVGAASTLRAARRPAMLRIRPTL